MTTKTAAKKTAKTNVEKDAAGNPMLTNKQVTEIVNGGKEIETVVEQDPKPALTPEELQAKLDAAMAEIEKLKGGKTAKTAPMTEKAKRRAAWTAMPEGEAMDDPSTILGRAQRLSREEQLVACIKATRAIKHADVAPLLALLVSKAADNGGVDGESTEESIFVEVIIKQKPKGGKKDEATT